METPSTPSDSDASNPGHLTVPASFVEQLEGGPVAPDSTTADQTPEATTAAIAADAEKAPETAVPNDDGLSEPTSDKPRGGSVFTRGSGSGGDGGGTATGGVLYGSSRK